MHTLVGNDYQTAIDIARQVQTIPHIVCWPVSRNGQTLDIAIDFDTLTDDDKDLAVERAYGGYVKSSALVGTPESCEAVVRSFRQSASAKSPV